MYFIDSHAHIYLPEFESEREEIMYKAKQAGIEKVLLPAIDSSTHEAMLQTAAQLDGCYAMMGLHPCSVGLNYEEEINIIERYLALNKFIAIGEIGLDFYWDKTFSQQQFQAFEKQIEIALKHHLPIAIHSRNAMDECIEIIKKHPGITGVFHCFSGTAEQAKQIIDMGFMLGIGGVVTFKNAGLDKVVEQLDLSHIILETDAPYLAPVPYRGKRNEPAYIKIIAEKLAALHHCSVEEIQMRTTENAEKLFNLNAQNVHLQPL